VVLAGVGAIAGSIIGQIGSLVIRRLYPVLPAYPPVWAVIAALVTAIVTGVAFSVLPARRAAALDPALALNRR
jgi:putative ABC transport system permease protein